MKSPFLKSVCVTSVLMLFSLVAYAKWEVYSNNNLPEGITAVDGSSHIITDGNWIISVYRYADDNWYLSRCAEYNGTGYIAGSGILDLRNVEADCGVVLKGSNNGALEKNNNIIEVYFPDTYKEMHGNTFKDCEKVGTVKLPETLVSLGEAALGYGKNSRVVWFMGPPPTMEADALNPNGGDPWVLVSGVKHAQEWKKSENLLPFDSADEKAKAYAAIKKFNLSGVKPIGKWKYQTGGYTHYVAVETPKSILVKIDDLVWGLPTIILILATGILLTIRTRGIQFTKLGMAFKQIFKSTSGAGELSGFSALCTALSATIGTGNIVGVATAIAAGGPGALFWMWFAAIVGTATKYAECMLAIKYREIKPDGSVLGGPFYTIEKGMGAKWKWLAVLFATFGVAGALLGIGTTTQINGITSAVNMAFKTETAFALFGNEYTWATVIGGAIVTICAALVIIGGLKRISKVAEKVVPAMAIIYVFLGLSVIIMNATKVPAAFALIFKSAFGFEAAAGGVAGFVLKQVMDSMQKGIARGIFSNEAGLGSAPIAAAPVQTKEPVEQGLVNMTGTVIDTLIVCTMTGLAIVIAMCNPEFTANGITGVELTSRSLSFDLGGDGVSVQFLLMVCLAFFAFTTILGWDYYSEKCLEYLTNGRMKFVMGYRVLYILMIAVGPYFTVEEVFTIADITNGLMAIPNCLSLIILSGVVPKETRSYFERRDRGELL